MKKKICLYIGRLSAGGANRFLLHLSEYLSNKGYHVDFVVANNTGNFSDKIPTGVNVMNLKSNRQLHSLPKLIYYIQKNKPELLLSTTHSSIIIGYLAVTASLENTKFIARQGTTLTKHFENKIKAKRRVEYNLIKNILAKSDRTIAISEGVKKDLTQCTKLKSDQIEVIYNPAIKSIKDVEKKASEDPNHRWLSSEDKKVILGAGRLVDQKDFKTLIQAFSLIDNHPNLRLIILGDGNKRSELKKLASEFNIEQKVSLPGHVDNPYSYMESSEVFVLSSAWEGFGMVIPEAMACGTPIVSTDCESGPNEILKNGKYGLLSPVGDHKTLSTNIQYMLHNPTPPALLKSRARRFTFGNLSKYEEIIDEALSN